MTIKQAFQKLFDEYNAKHFQGAFNNVDWNTWTLKISRSMRVKNCGWCAPMFRTIKINLMMHRDKQDMKQTLLHEMVHGYIWLKGGNAGEGHTEKFHAILKAAWEKEFPDTPYNPDAEE